MISGMKVEGLKDLHRAFEKCADGMFDGIVEAAEIGSFIQLTEMARRIPVDEGELKNGLGSKVNPKKSNRAVTVDTGIIENPSGREDFFVKAASVEHGHASPGKAGGVKTTPAHSYGRSTLDETKKSVRSAVRAKIAGVVSRLNGS